MSHTENMVCGAMKSWEIVLKIPVTNHGTCYRFTGYEC